MAPIRPPPRSPTRKQLGTHQEAQLPAASNSLNLRFQYGVPPGTHLVNVMAIIGTLTLRKGKSSSSGDDNRDLGVFGHVLAQIHDALIQDKSMRVLVILLTMQQAREHEAVRWLPILNTYIHNGVLKLPPSFHLIQLCLLVTPANRISHILMNPSASSGARPLLNPCSDLETILLGLPWKAARSKADEFITGGAAYLRADDCLEDCQLQALRGARGLTVSPARDPDRFHASDFPEHSSQLLRILRQCAPTLQRVAITLDFGHSLESILGCLLSMPHLTSLAFLPPATIKTSSGLRRTLFSNKDMGILCRLIAFHVLDSQVLTAFAAPLYILGPILRGLKPFAPLLTHISFSCVDLIESQPTGTQPQAAGISETDPPSEDSPKSQSKMQAPGSRREDHAKSTGPLQQKNSSDVAPM